MLRGSRAFSGKINRPFLAKVVPPFATRVSGRHLAVQVGTTKDQGLYNKPSAAVHPGALAAGTLPQYNRLRPLPNTEHFDYFFTSFIGVIHSPRLYNRHSQLRRHNVPQGTQ